MTCERYHFLDGLRGVAMLLGLVLHGAMSFRWPGIWGADEVSAAPEFFGWVFDAIHGFRMQLFFLVSGFFTMMLAKRRGLWPLVKQRLLRIGLPLVVGSIILSPMITLIGEWSEDRKEARADLVEDGEKEEKFVSGNLLEAVAIGDTQKVRELIDEGVDLEATGETGETALISAAFLGRVESVEMLLEAGADIEASDHHGTTPLKAATMDFEIVEAIAGTFELQADQEGRKECAVMLRTAGATGKAEENEMSGLIWMLTFYPVFHHLWFLYYLCWLVAAFSVVAKLPWRVPDSLIVSPLALLWLIPTTWYFQTLMPGQVGPGTATGVVPHWPKLGYYAVFFFFGVSCYGRGFLESGWGRLWPLWLALSVPCLCYARDALREENAIWAQLAAVSYAWLIIAVFFGVFRRFLNQGHPAVRYLSDASYWLYLAHLPLVMVVQVLMGPWELSVWMKFPLVLLIVTVPLVIVYEYAVRYTWVGAILNGRKFRNGPPPLPKE
ncbi:MAG: acyltransferase family protein [Akkermansiaceae bacterium]